MDLSSIDALYAYGLRISNYKYEIDSENKNEATKFHSERLSENLNSLLALHGTTILMTERGNQLLRAAASFSNTGHEKIYQQVALNMAEKIQNSHYIFSYDAIDTVNTVNNDIGKGSNPDRSNEVAHSTNFNLLATLGKIVVLGTGGTIAASALVASIPGSAASSVGTGLINYSWLFLIENELLIRGLIGAAGQELIWVISLLDWVKSKT